MDNEAAVIKLIQGIIREVEQAREAESAIRSFQPQTRRSYKLSPFTKNLKPSTSSFHCLRCPRPPHHHSPCQSDCSHLTHSMSSEISPLWELENLLVNKEHMLLTVRVNDKNKAIFTSFTRSQIDHILTWSKTIFKDPSYDKVSTNGRPAGLKYFLTGISSHPLAARLPQIKKGTVIIEAKDVKVPTVDDIMGSENISKAVTHGTKRTYEDAITQEVEYKSLRESQDIAHNLLMEKYRREQLQKVKSVIQRERKSHEKKVCATWEADRKCSRLAGNDLMDFDDEGTSTKAGSSTVD